MYRDFVVLRSLTAFLSFTALIVNLLAGPLDLTAIVAIYYYLVALLTVGIDLIDAIASLNAPLSILCVSMTYNALLTGNSQEIRRTRW